MTDRQALARLGQSGGSLRGRHRRRLTTRAVRGVPVATARRRLPWPLLLLLAVLLAAGGYLGFAAAEQTAHDEAATPALAPDAALDPEGARRVTAVDRVSRSSAVPAVVVPGTPATMAEVEGLAVLLPHPEARLVAFHEASLPEALALTPVGRLDANDNPAKFEAAPDGEGPAYRVLPSRGRPRPATSAVDVVVPKGATVTAPVSGTVVEARQYALYGGVRDWRVVIVSAERPDLHAVLIHLHGPAVAVGDEVVAGRTPIGVARRLPFTSQVDALVGASLPHVHLEVKAATAPKPADPNAPAAEPDAVLDLSAP